MPKIDNHLQVIYKEQPGSRNKFTVVNGKMGGNKVATGNMTIEHSRPTMRR